MPAARDVGAPFIAPACRHTVRLGDVHELFPRAMAGGPFASSTAARREKCGLAPSTEKYRN